MTQYSLGFIRIFKTPQFRVEVEAFEEESPDLSFDETGETKENLRTGKWTCFRVRARVVFQGHTIGEDHLGDCIYASIEEFQDHRECGKQNREWARQGVDARCGSYFSDMVHAAIHEARQTIKAYQTVKVRV